MCGYLSGYMLANLVGLTTQVPMAYEVVSNNAATDYRKIVISRTKVIVRRPKVSVTNENAGDYEEAGDFLFGIGTVFKLLPGKNI